MEIPKLIKEAHKNAIDKGFYNCPECSGIGRSIKSENSKCLSCKDYINRNYDGCVDCIPLPCENCNFTGIDPDKNISELLMLIVSELGKALEAYRENRFADWKRFQEFINKNTILNKSKEHAAAIKDQSFSAYIRNTFEDKITDVFIKLFDLCGYLVEPENYDVIINNYNNSMPDLYEANNYGEWMFRFIKYYLLEIAEGSDKNYIPAGAIGRSLAAIKRFADRNNIPIEKHIAVKMEYNKISEICGGENRKDYDLL